MQGFNMGRYVPPDLEGTASGNQVNRKHALGNRASKLASQGILTVRFEMPFAVWCGHCPKPTIIGQGVRFNAEKKKVGNYYSTPIYSFRMRHVECGGAIEIRTDPRNTAYEVVEGGKRREDREADAEGQVEILTEKEREQLRSSAFAKLEKTIEDREQLTHAKVRIEELEDASQRAWEDPYEQNRRLRREFRVGRHAREKEGRASEDLQDRMSLGIELVPAHEDDARRAALVEFAGPTANGMGARERVLSKPLFGTNGNTAALRNISSSTTSKKRLKSESTAAQMRDSIVSEIVGNTRAAHDPFLISNPSSGVARLSGIKRKRIEAKGTEHPGKVPRKEDSGVKRHLRRWSRMIRIPPDGYGARLGLHLKIPKGNGVKRRSQ
ncbi:CWC16 protein [Apiospora kogelbergensis]|uniref:CWC16 protein n=1 Tax=Apiospora kogelbergensis TaxID=1337665 RepID=A0AAW0R0C3_9PEZI